MQVVEHSIWGLSPAQLHDRYWASRGVQVVRQGEPSEILARAELFLLTDARSLAIFGLGRAVDVFAWAKPRLICLRLSDRRERGYRERALVDADSRFIAFERLYGAADSRMARVALTRDRELARAWQSTADPRQAWRTIRRAAGARGRHALRVAGRVYDRSVDQDVVEFARRLVQVWPRPDATVPRVARHAIHVWADRDATVASAATFVGPVWVGAGRRVERDMSVVGPGILWDDPARRPRIDRLQWEAIEPTERAAPGAHAMASARVAHPRRRSAAALAAKRAFDLSFALLAIALTLPLYPFIMLAIWLEDGRPFFFAHRRETLGGREFPCVKFRSMRKDAERIKKQLAGQNQADGPQFFMENDPRLTRVGRVLRKLNLDELPQFFNVLMGDMSIVGPRPSPYRENQYCPPWREARLSVRPGITGLWQVMRTREAGTDFQEWIKYDIEYVEHSSWRLDLWILWKTLRLFA